MVGVITYIKSVYPNLTTVPGGGSDNISHMCIAMTHGVLWGNENNTAFKGSLINMN
jgi:hypothetical protein